MKAILIPAALAVALASGSVTQPAKAAGCLKGAVVGGLVGHFAHHGVLGAAAGCAIGHHEAAKQAQTMQQSRVSGRGTGDNNDYEGSASHRQ